MASKLDDGVLEAGRSALRKYGYAGTTAERLAQEAGVSRVTLHRRGITRDLVIAALVERSTERYRAALWPALTGSGNAGERLEAALNALCDAAEADLELLVALRAQSDGVFHESGDEVLTRDVFTDPLVRMLRDGAEDGSLRAVDAMETATALFNMVGWTYVHLRTGHGWTARRARKSCVDLALHGVVATT